MGGAAFAGYLAPDFRVMTFGFVVPVVYVAGITAVSAALTRHLPLAVRARVPLVLATMHTCWGAGFLTSPRRLVRPKGPE